MIIEQPWLCISNQIQTSWAKLDLLPTFETLGLDRFLSPCSNFLVRDNNKINFLHSSYQILRICFFFFNYFSVFFFIKYMFSISPSQVIWVTSRRRRGSGVHKQDTRAGATSNKFQRVKSSHFCLFIQRFAAHLNTFTEAVGDIRSTTSSSWWPLFSSFIPHHLGHSCHHKCHHPGRKRSRSSGTRPR